MRTVRGICAQGDMLIIPVRDIPKDVTPVDPVGDHYILAHSETGHHHVIDKAKAEVFLPADEEFTLFIRSLDDSAEITHEREFNTHESLKLPKGEYMLRRQREHTPEGDRRIED